MDPQSWFGRIVDPEPRIQGPKIVDEDQGYRILDPGSCAQDPGSDPVSGILDPGSGIYRILAQDPG